MHSSMHTGVLKAFIEAKHSTDTYLKILSEAGLTQKDFEGDEYHNDAEVQAALAAAETVLGQSRSDILTEMGLFGAPGLFEEFKDYLDPNWDILDFLENVEPRMHKYVSEEMGAFPPALKSERISANELKITTKSHRRMAGLAKGFILGFASVYGDAITVDVEESDTGYAFAVKKVSADRTAAV